VLIMSATDNLLQLAARPTWYDHIPDVEAAMRESSRICTARFAAGWEMGDEGGWWAPHPESGELITQSEWEELGLPLPEDAVI
jgi:hypothetical protein